MALVTKWLLGILAVLLALGFGMGCELSAEDDDTNYAVYSYNLDEMERGIFNSTSHTMTLNEWYSKARWWENSSYDQWSQREGKYFYKEGGLTIPFFGFDIVNENTVIYCDFVINSWQGERIGHITGSITLTGIFNPNPKVWIGCKDNPDSTFWRFTGKINMSGAADTATLNWSIPIYDELFNPSMESRFALFVLPNGSKSEYGFEVPIPIVKTINVNTDVGSLGTVSIKGITLSGTLNITYNGEPVPYVMLLALRQAGSAIQEVHFSSPEPNAPWSMILESVNYQRDIVFQAFCYSEDGVPLIDAYATPVIRATNQDKSGIVLDLGEVAY
jgi:hypothetical protein